MNKYLIVFDDGSGDEIDLKAFVDSLDENAKMLALDGHVCFLQSKLTVDRVSGAFVKFAGSRLYYISDISKSDYSGRMPGVFWEEFMEKKVRAAAE
jgi:hypothetical protein